MAARNFGDYTVDLEPHYQFTQTLPRDANIFASALLASEKMLSDPENTLETRYSYQGIPCKQEVVKPQLIPEFVHAFPSTSFSAFDVSVPAESRLDSEDIAIDLHDAKNPRRHLTISLSEDGNGIRRVDRFAIHDTHKNRKPKSASSISRDEVRSFLAWQLNDSRFGREAMAFDMDERQLCMLLGQLATGQRRTIIAAHTKLSEKRVLHTEKEDVYDASSRAGKPVSTTYSTWLTGDVADDTLGMAEDIRVRTIAVQDRDFRNPHNTLKFEVHATLADPEDDTEAQELTTHLVMHYRSQRLMVARAFMGVLGDYLRSERE